ncbi:MAG TPA: type IV secretion system DNA-binding domain-containing protein [Patescibacteria group bacterium]|nr:type IV secretion system DNA-binding domain-containing protein [Patescibacteria group bacterium]
MENPANNNDITYFAETNFRNERRKFGIKRDDRRRHFYVVGKTGMGKTVMLANMIVQDIQRGEGLAVVDPHGELVEELLDFIPSKRINDVVYFNPSDLEHPIAFNILESVDDEYKHLVSSGLMGVFTKIWANMWSARMEYILNNCILALLDSPGNTLLGINRLLVDKEYRKKIVSKIKDPVVKAFWVEEYANYNERFRTEAIAPIQNKVGQFLSSSVIRNIVGQSKSTIDMREIMDNRKILVLNLSKGRIGEDNSALLGAMMITKIQLAAMSRVDIPEPERKDFYLYVDEFQNFATESFADILSEARKYRLNLIMAHQYVAQLTSVSGGGRVTKVKDAVFGNVGTIVMFRIGAPDAEDLIKEFEPYFVEEDLVNLTKYQIYLRLMIDGVASKPFSARTLPPIKIDEKGAREKVIAVSRERYANDRLEVEEKIMRWSGLEETMGSAAKEAKLDGDEAIFRANYVAKNQNYEEKTEEEKDEDEEEDKDKTKAICDNCSKPVNIKFQPDSKRNVFCKECLKKFKAGEIDASQLPKRNIPAEEKKDDEVIQPKVIKPIGPVVSQSIGNKTTAQTLAPGQVVMVDKE